MKLLNKISDIVFKIEKVLAIILVIGLLISMSGGVFFRYVLTSPLFWSDEFAIFCLIWITFIGGSMSLKYNASPSITILSDLLPKKYKKYLLAISNVILFVFILYILYLAIEWIMMPNIIVQTSTAMNLPKIYFYISVPVSFAFSVVHVLNNIFLSLTNKEADGERDVEKEGSLL